MKNLFYRLMIYLDTASETDTNYFIALFMANNFYRIPVLNAQSFHTLKHDRNVKWLQKSALRSEERRVGKECLS